ncbi:hypothetical protein [uncultured Clostridium sp.]|uniref:hypothetical protein n=1 Tax=uncultured Clostridium sp. TaxID=59620 RepID=UPI0028E7E849|nr:hypothetical protein [uncultured Clostridium sp.]
MKDYYEQFKLLVNSYIILENKFYKFKDAFDQVVRLYNNELQENERLKRKIKELINKHE